MHWPSVALRVMSLSLFFADARTHLCGHLQVLLTAQAV